METVLLLVMTLVAVLSFVQDMKDKRLAREEKAEIDRLRVELSGAEVRAKVAETNEAAYKNVMETTSATMVQGQKVLQDAAVTLQTFQLTLGKRDAAIADINQTVVWLYEAMESERDKEILNEAWKSWMWRNFERLPEGLA